MHRYLLPIALLALVEACFPAPRHRVPYRGGGPGQRLSGGTTIGGGSRLTGSPREQLNQLDNHLRARGYGQAGPAVHNSDMPEHGLIAYAIEAQAGKCYAAVALAHEGNDLNMIVLDPQGRTVGYDVRPDSHPWITFCPNEPGRHIARLQMSRGNGEYYYALYEGDRSGQPQLEALFGTKTSERVRRAELDDQARKRLQKLDKRLAEQQYERAGEPQGIVMHQGQAQNFPLNLEAGTCYTFAAVPGQGAKDADVYVVDGGGNELARDVSTSTTAVVEYCPEDTGSYQVRAGLYEGGGPVFVASYVKGGVNQQVPVMSTEAVASGGLEDNFRLLDAELAARGYRQYDDQSRGELSEGGTRDFDIHLDGGKCYAILAVGDDGVRNLDMVLLDERGQEVDRDVERDARPIVRVCPEGSGEFVIRVRMQDGSGHFVYAPYRWPRGTRGPFGLAGLMYVRVAELTQLLDVEGYQPDPSYTPGKDRLAHEGDLRRHDLQLKGGECYSVIAVGGKGVADLDVTLRRGGRKLASDVTHNAFPSVRHCPADDGPFTLQVQSAMGAGEYFYQVFRRNEQTSGNSER